MEPYEYLQNAIISGELLPGQRLTETMLADQLNISRTPIRQALHRLEFDGLVTPLTKGYIVTSFSKKDIHNIYQLRALLEGHAAFEAALKRNSTHLSQLKEANSHFATYVQQNIQQHSKESIEQIVHYNKVFHNIIFDAAQNEYLKKHVNQVVILPLMYRSFYWYDVYELQRSLHVHRSITHAIEIQHPERAKTVMQEHVFQALDHIMDHLKEE